MEPADPESVEMSDAGFSDVTAALTSPDTLPFFVEEVKNSDWFASVQKPTRIVSWAKDSLPDEMRARIPPSVSQVEADERYAGAVVLFLLSLSSWVLSSTVGLMPLMIVTVVVGLYYCIPALMKRRGLRLSPPKQLEFFLAKVDEIVCERIPPRFRCSTKDERTRLCLLCAVALLLWRARYHLHRLVLPTIFMVAGGAIVHMLVVRPLKAQLRVVIDEHNESQTHHSNSSAENEQLRQTEALLGGENARLQEEVKRLQGLADEYKSQYERQAEISAQLQREGVPPEAAAVAVAAGGAAQPDEF